jgi:hypothetical protein
MRDEPPDRRAAPPASDAPWAAPRRLVQLEERGDGRAVGVQPDLARRLREVALLEWLLYGGSLA